MTTPVGTAAQLGERIRQERLHQEFTQDALANRAGVGRQWLNRLENGQVHNASFELIMRVLAALDLQITLAAPPPTPTWNQQPTPIIDLNEIINATQHLQRDARQTQENTQEPDRD